MDTENNIFNAIKDGKLKSVQQFIQKGIDVNTQDKIGNSLLMNAVLNEQTDIAAYLISLNPNLYLYNEENYTVFPIAERLKDKSIFNLLLDKCLNSNHRFLNGKELEVEQQVEMYRSFWKNEMDIEYKLEDSLNWEFPPSMWDFGMTKYKPKK